MYWPVGEAADNIRALFLRASIAEALGDQKAGRQARTLWKKLTGEYEPNCDPPDLKTKKKQMKQTMQLFSE